MDTFISLDEFFVEGSASDVDIMSSSDSEGEDSDCEAPMPIDFERRGPGGAAQFWCIIS
uniref:Pheromone phb3.4 n=1 Tax=Pleurotus eryngii var. eryngii TaxID=280321 RepID=X2DBJ9_PLEER|nr:pheromone phb3.4 [Pleurotus eryngii var. eryngii]